MIERDRLDTAIDQVAARMVAVPDDPDLVQRIVSALPEPSRRFGWLIPQFAALSAIVAAAVLWSMRDRPAAPPILPSTTIAAFSVLPAVSAREPEPGTQPSEPSEPSELPEPLRSDFDRALPALALSVIGPESLPAAEALTVAPLEIGELPLTPEAEPRNF